MKRMISAFCILVLSGFVTLANAQQNFAINAEPQEVANVRFQNEAGKKLSLSDFRGQVLLVNIWATWCPPCVKEMPTLDRLQGKLGSAKFKVLTLSIDRGGAPAVRAFFDKIAVQNLDIYVDETMLSATALRAFGLPATVLIDAEGREIGRLIGPAEWDAPEMVTFLEGVIK